MLTVWLNRPEQRIISSSSFVWRCLDAAAETRFELLFSLLAFCSWTKEQAIKFKLCRIMHSFYGRCPAYLTTTVQSLNACRPHLGHRLRSTSSTDFSLPQLRTKFGERAFSHAGPAAWNSMPEEHIRAEPDIRVFRKLFWRHIFLT